MRVANPSLEIAGGSYYPHLNLKLGGDNRDRTDDLCSAIAALSQLSYVPVDMKIPRS